MIRCAVAAQGEGFIRLAERDLTSGVIHLKRRISRGLVNVVAQVHEHVHLLRRQVAVAMEVLAGVVLARHDGEANAHVRVIRGGRLGAPGSADSDAAGVIRVAKAVVIRSARVEALNARLHTVVERGLCDQGAACCAIQ